MHQHGCRGGVLASARCKAPDIHMPGRQASHEARVEVTVVCTHFKSLVTVMLTLEWS